MSKGILFFAVSAAFVFTMYATMASAKKPQYVGNQGCKCHKPEMDEWEKSPHGKAFEMLVAKNRSRDENKAMRDAKLDIKKDYDKDEKCLPCHTVGYGKPGGYEDDKSAKDLVGVGCEMCHGPGSEYRNLHKEKEETFTRAEAKAKIVSLLNPLKVNAYQAFIESKNSPFDLVCFSFEIRNSMASVVPIGFRIRRNT